MYFSEEYLSDKEGFVCYPFKTKWWCSQRYDEIRLLGRAEGADKVFKFDCNFSNDYSTHSDEYLNTVRFLQNYFNNRKVDM